MDIQGDTAANTKLDELTIANNAQREAIGFQNQGANFNAQAAADMIAGDNSQVGGQSAAVGSLLTGAGQVASKWYNYTTDFPSTSDPWASPALSSQYQGGGFYVQVLQEIELTERETQFVRFIVEGFVPFSGGRESRMVDRLRARAHAQAAHHRSHSRLRRERAGVPGQDRGQKARHRIFTRRRRGGMTVRIVTALEGRPLTPRQKAFVAAYARCGVGMQAAIEAGYSPASASARVTRC